jgi:hypothetical protein
MRAVGRCLLAISAAFDDLYDEPAQDKIRQALVTLGAKID